MSHSADDPELVALSAVLVALRDLDVDAQARVLKYAGERLVAQRFNLDTLALMENMTKGLDAINQAAVRLNAQGPDKVSGLKLVDVIARMYEQASADA